MKILWKAYNRIRLHLDVCRLLLAYPSVDASTHFERFVAKDGNMHTLRLSWQDLSMLYRIFHKFSNVCLPIAGGKRASLSSVNALLPTPAIIRNWTQSVYGRPRDFSLRVTSLQLVAMKLISMDSAEIQLQICVFLYLIFSRLCKWRQKEEWPESSRRNYEPAVALPRFRSRPVERAIHGLSIDMCCGIVRKSDQTREQVSRHTTNSHFCATSRDAVRAAETRLEWL